jgi:hypothetical protein
MRSRTGELESREVSDSAVCPGDDRRLPDKAGNVL